MGFEIWVIYGNVRPAAFLMQLVRNIPEALSFESLECPVCICCFHVLFHLILHKSYEMDPNLQEVQRLVPSFLALRAGLQAAVDLRP